MEFSNVHLAYGDDSVYQQLTCEEFVANGTDDTLWTGRGTMLRAVKNSNNSYTSVVRADDGLLMYEGAEYMFPMNALHDAKMWYVKNIKKMD